jgi:hypothetical protein
MRSSSLFRLFFILYCIEAGLFFFFAPWSRVWDQALIELPVTTVRAWLLAPPLRGAVSGFGLIHLLWGAHDLYEILTRKTARPAAPRGESGGA